MVKQGYKQTEVGVIPEDWDVRKIGDFTDATAGGTPSTSHPEYWNGEILWMSSGELNKRRIHNVIGRITELGYNNSSTHMIPENCVLIGLAGQGKTRGTVAVNYVELCTNQSIAAIFPSKEHNSEYLYQNLWSRYEELRELSSGDGGRGGLNLTIIKNFPCAFPKLQEQNRIAEALSDVDELISSLEKLIEKYKSIKATCLQQMFPQKGETTPKMRLPGFTGAWEQRKLLSLCDKFTDGDWIEAKDQSNSGVRLIQTGNVGVAEFLDKPNNKKWVSEDTFEALHCEEVFEGDILISRLPEPAGRACIVPNIGTKMITAVDCTIVRVSENTSNEFLLQYLSSQRYFDEVNTCLAGGTRQRISRSNLADFDIPVPVQKQEQQAIGHFFRNLDNLITLHQRKLDKAKKIKQGMMQQLLTGKIRLV